MSPGGRRRRRHQTMVALGMVAPAFAIYGLFLLWPIGKLVLLSLTQANENSTTEKFIGLQNYKDVVTNGAFWTAFVHNVEWVGFAAIPVVLGLVVALVLDRRPGRFGGPAYRVMFLIPYTLPVVVIGFVWSIIYNPTFGPLNAILHDLHLGFLAQDWFGSTSLALPSLAVAADWPGIGLCMLLFLTGIAALDRSLNEAATVDGANAWQSFWHVTLPGLRNTVNVVVLIIVIATLRVFDIDFVTTNGSPQNATQVLGTLIYNTTFENYQVGYGAAMAVVTTVLILLWCSLYLRVRATRASQE
jgi:raffinose/stachyose/melibiose transport system permease protein